MIGLAENIYLWRIFRKLSQEELAKNTGIPRPNLSAIESGKREPSIRTLRLLANSLKISPGMLINGTPPIDFKKCDLSRDSLEAIVYASFNKTTNRLSPYQKTINSILSGVIKNKINAKKKVNRNIRRYRRTYINNWLMLKASLERDALNNLLARLDKKLTLYENG